MKYKDFRSDEIEIEDQRPETHKLRFIKRYLDALMGNPQIPIRDDHSQASDYIGYDDAGILYDDWTKEVPTKGKPSFTGLAPDIGKFKDHRYDDYLMGKVNRKAK